MFKLLVNLVYYGTITAAVVVFVVLVLIECAALWHWFH